MNVKGRKISDTDLGEKYSLSDVEESATITNPEHIGHHLRKKRQQKKVQIEEVSDTLRIGSRYLCAIEDGRVDLLPERVYTLGFVRAYAQYLGESPAHCVKLFKQQILLEEQTLTLSFSEPLKKATTPNKLYLVASISAAVMLILLWALLRPITKEKLEPSYSTTADKTFARSQKADPLLESTKEPSVSHSASQRTSEADSANLKDLRRNEKALGSKEVSSSIITKDTTNETLSNNQTVGKPLAALQNDKQSIEQSIKLICTETSWVQINNAQGGVLFMKTMLPGDTFELPQQKGLILYTGNAGGLNIAIGNTIPKVLGMKGEVKNHISLDAQHLLPYLNAR